MHGPHLMLDCYQCDPKAVRDLNSAYRLLDELPTRVGMTKITKPQVFLHQDREGEEPGVTGVVIIAESHIAMHSFPSRGNYLTLDVYSCKEFSRKDVLAFVKEIYKPKLMEENFVERGKLNKARELAHPPAHRH